MMLLWRLLAFVSSSRFTSTLRFYGQSVLDCEKSDFYQFKCGLLSPRGRRLQNVFSRGGLLAVSLGRGIET